MSPFPVPCTGTDATHAEHIETIKTRNYVGVQGDGSFVPGELGMGLVEGELEWNGNMDPCTSSNVNVRLYSKILHLIMYALMSATNSV